MSFVSCYNYYNCICIVGGDLTDSEQVLSWLTSEDVFATGDEIEEVNRHMLDKLLGEDDFVAVYFCKYHLFSI